MKGRCKKKNLHIKNKKKLQRTLFLLFAKKCIKTNFLASPRKRNNAFVVCFVAYDTAI